MKVSIITVCFNSELTIKETINSVINQTYNDIEYIIIDGKSTDNTLNIIKKYSNRVNVLISEKDDGLYHAMNKGVSLATGDVIGILNSDDLFYSKNTIKNVLKYFIEDEKIKILYGNIIFFNSLTGKVTRFWKSKSYYKSFFEHGNIPPHPSVFIKKEIYSKNKFNTNFKIAADYEFLLRLLKKTNITSKYINENIVRMREGGISTTAKNLFFQNIEVFKSWQCNNLTIPWYFFILRIYKKIKQLK